MEILKKGTEVVYALRDYTEKDDYDRTVLKTDLSVSAIDPCGSVDISVADRDELRKLAQRLIDEDIYGGGLVLALIEFYEQHAKKEDR